MSEIRRFTKIIMSADGTPDASAEVPNFRFEIHATVERVGDGLFRVITKSGEANIAPGTVVDRKEDIDKDKTLLYLVEVIDSEGDEHSMGWWPELSLKLATIRYGGRL